MHRLGNKSGSLGYAECYFVSIVNLLLSQALVSVDS